MDLVVYMPRSFPIAGLQPRDKAAMLVDKSIIIIILVVEENALFLPTSMAAVTSAANQQYLAHQAKRN